MKERSVRDRLAGDERLPTPHAADEERWVTADIPYRILASNGHVLGYAHRLQQALDNFNHWDQATAIVLGNYVVLKRKIGGVR